MLRQLRIVSAAYCGALLVIGLVAFLLASSRGDGASGPFGPASAAVAVLALAGVVLSRRILPTLVCAPPAAVAAAYRSRFLLRCALCEAPALVGFVLVNVTGSVVPYLAALPISLAGLLLNVPRTMTIQAEEERMAMEGCATPLLATLAGVPTNPIS